jgi:hypothetical protein
VQISQAKAAIDSVLQDADRMLTATSPAVKDSKKSNATRNLTESSLEVGFAHYRRKITDAKGMLLAILDAEPDADQIAEIYGLLASTEKREAQTYIRRINDSGAEESIKALQQSLSYYLKFAQIKPTISWPIHQSLSLSLALGQKQDAHGTMWLQAFGMALAVLERGPERDALWARTDLIELFLLACDTSRWTLGHLVDKCVLALAPTTAGSSYPDTESASGDAAREHLLFHARELLRQKWIDPFPAEATCRQALRYHDWLTGLPGNLLDGWGNNGYKVREAAKSLLELLDP